jgi:uncharacterized protein YggU (UPF0235/DUF167 family)
MRAHATPSAALEAHLGHVKPQAESAAFVIAVRVKPGSKRTFVGGTHPGRLGAALVVAVRERAVEGSATEAVRRALATALAVPAGSVRLRVGETSRDKLFEISDPPPGLSERLRELLAARP